jgi:alpha-tubulin suppressor-like RCC1 family protein
MANQSTSFETRNAAGSMSILGHKRDVKKLEFARCRTSSISGGLECLALPVYEAVRSQAAWLEGFPTGSVADSVTSLAEQIRATQSYICSIGLSDEGAAVVDNTHRVWLCGTWSQSTSRRATLMRFYDQQALHRVSIKAIACGARHLCMLSSSGRVWAWGASEFGALGCDKDELQEPRCVQLRRARQVACTRHATFAVVSGSVYSWGRDTESGLQSQGVGHRVYPANIQLGAGIVAESVQCGLGHTLVLCSKGNLFSFGRNSVGQCGIGTLQEIVFAPVKLRTHVFSKLLESYETDAGGEASRAILAGATAIELADLQPHFCEAACGAFHTIARDTSGNVWGWGWNKFGMLGDNTNENKLWPVKVFSSSTLQRPCKISWLACMGDSSMVRLQNEEIYAAGRLHSENKPTAATTAFVGPSATTYYQDERAQHVNESQVCSQFRNVTNCSPASNYLQLRNGTLLCHKQQVQPAVAHNFGGSVCLCLFERKNRKAALSSR